MSGKNRVARVMVDLITIFDEYAKTDGKRGTLTKAELKALLESDMCHMLKNPKDPGSLDKIMKDMDVNGDSLVDFQEFASMVCCITCACHGGVVPK